MGHPCGRETGDILVLPSIDFETYSEAGYYFDEGGKRRSIVKTAPHGIGAVGAAVYSEHPSTEVLSVAYDLRDGLGPRLWIPEMIAPPLDLFAHVETGGILSAWNSLFEYFIWTNVCTPRMGWPVLNFWQMRDSMAAARAYSLPGALGKCAAVLGATEKIADGKRLLQKFSVPRSETKADKRRRIRPLEDTEDAQKLYDYNIRDIGAEADIAQRIPPLSAEEERLWLLDQLINIRGIAIDIEGANHCKSIIEGTQAAYTAELQKLTGGAVKTAGELAKLAAWANGRGVPVKSLDADSLAEWLSCESLPPDVRRAFEIRAALSSASVKKIYAILNRLCSDGRLRDLFAYSGADRTGRWSGKGPQPHNLPNSGVKVNKCGGCGHHYRSGLDRCPWCRTMSAFSDGDVEWGPEAVEDVLAVAAYRDHKHVETVFGDALTAVSCSLRGLFIAGEGKELICADYSAIEARVLAMLAGEQWRIDVFRTHGLIYEASAAKICGLPFEDFIEYKKQHGKHHPMRAKIGKVAELASGYQGGFGAWMAFGAGEHLTEQEIRDGVKGWRAASPMIVKLWYALEDAARNAIQHAGITFETHGLKLYMEGSALRIRLLSGRCLTYHNAYLVPDVTPWGREVMKIHYWGYNTNSQKAPVGWILMDTYGGKLTENVTQAIARDILAHAMPNLERRGYHIVLHVHDEVCAEVPAGFGSIEEFERIMVELPDWCSDWPIKAAGGWRGKRFRK